MAKKRTYAESLIFGEEPEDETPPGGAPPAPETGEVKAAGRTWRPAATATKKKSLLALLDEEEAAKGAPEAAPEGEATPRKKSLLDLLDEEEATKGEMPAGDMADAVTAWELGLDRRSEERKATQTDPRFEKLDIFLDNLSRSYDMQEHAEKGRAEYLEGRAAYESMTKRDPAYAVTKMAAWMQKAQMEMAGRGGQSTLSPYEQGMLDEFGVRQAKFLELGGKTAGALGLVAGGGALAYHAPVLAAGAGLFAALDYVDEHTSRRAIWGIVKNMADDADTLTRITHGESAQQYNAPEDWAKNMAKETLTGALLNATHPDGRAMYPWWIAVPAGMLADYYTSVLYASGIGAGLVQLPKAVGGVAGKFHKMAKQLRLPVPEMKGAMPEMAERIGLKLRNPLTWKRHTIGIPGTESLTAFARKNAVVHKLISPFIPESVARGPHMRIIEEGLGDPKQAEAWAAMHKAMGPEFEKFVAKTSKLSTKSKARAALIVPYIEPAKRGSAKATEIIQKIMRSPQEVEAAEQFVELSAKGTLGFKMSTALRYGDLHAGAKKHIDSVISETIELQEKALGKLRVKVPVPKRALTSHSTVEKVLASLGGPKGHSEEAARELMERFYGGVKGELGLKSGKVRGQLSKYVQETLEGRKAAAEKLKAMLGKKEEAITGRLAGRAKGLGKAAEKKWMEQRAGMLVKDVERYPEVKELFESQRRIEGIIEKMKKLPGARKQGLLEAQKELAKQDQVLRRAIEQRGAIQTRLKTTEESAKMLDRVVTSLQGESPRNLMGRLRKSLTVAEMGKQKDVVESFEAIHQMRATVNRRLNLLRSVAAGKTPKGVADAEITAWDKLLTKARSLDEKWAERTGYIPHVEITGKKSIPEPRAYDVQPSPLSLSGHTQQRGFKDPMGFAQTHLDLENQIKTVINNPDAPFDNRLKDMLKRAYGADTWEKTVKLVKKDIATEGDDFIVMSKIYDMDLPNLLTKQMEFMASDAGTYEMVRGLGHFVSDVADTYHSRPAKDFGEVAAKMYPGKWLPQDLKDQYDSWRKLRASLSQPAFRAPLVTAINSLWKFQATAPRPSFQFRNHLDDLMRFATEGAYNPARLHVNGVRIMAKSGSKVNVPVLGQTISYRDAFYLADGYRVFDSGVAADAIQGLGRTGQGSFFRSFSYPENARRAGLFMERLLQGMAPAEAAASVRRVAYPTTHLARWEKGFSNIFMPFYGFRRYNVPKMAQQLYANPAWLKVNLGLFMNARKLGEEGAGERWDIMPDYLKETAVYAYREPGMTHLLTIPGMSVSDLSDLLDVAGNPRGEFMNALESLYSGLAPGIKIPAEIIATLGGASSKWSLAPTEIPREFEKLAETGIGKMVFHIDKQIEKQGEGYRERYVWPKAMRTFMSYLSVYNELRKALRPEAVKKATTNLDLLEQMANPDSLKAFFTGISWSKVSDIEIQHKFYTDVVQNLEGYAASHHMTDSRGNLLPQYMKGPYGKILGSMRKYETQLERARYDVDYLERLGIRGEVPEETVKKAYEPQE
uniref:Large polyvalent protein associated domain-containing protein n=1 Tax=viral metagenome TaxID=1070528 RepID=A0A6M3KH08_9ZZZZ